MLTHTTTGFSKKPLHKRKEPNAFHYVSQRTSFWIASFSIVAFIAGNMIGQHGWNVFLASVLGYDDSQIVYTGTVAPIAEVPDYAKWSLYGGNAVEHTFNEVPQDALIPLPAYSSSEQLKSDSSRMVYSIGHMGSYETGAEESGSHPGVDIRVPVGTPVRSIANGIVTVAKENGSFGKVIVVKHPNVPDPEDPKKQTTLYSVYAHLSANLVKEGDMVTKAQRIGLSGKTGFATGPHLHFQIDREEAPWHPYWPFSDSEARAAGLSFTQAVNKTLFQSKGLLFTVNPVLYAQANYAAPTTVAQNTNPEVKVDTPKAAAPVKRLTFVERLRESRAKRVASRAERQKFSDRILTISAEAEQTTAVVETTPVVTTPVAEKTASFGIIPTSAEISTDQSFNRGWEKVRITLLDARGEKILVPDLGEGYFLRVAYGTATFRPDKLKASDFKDGEAEINMLPSGNRTILIKLDPLGTLSKPMVYEK